MTNNNEQLDRLYAAPVHRTEGKKDEAFTYGEITRVGVDQLLNMFSFRFGEDDVFYDMGCGYGKMLAHIAIERKMKKICGVELDLERADSAIENFKNFTFPHTKPEIIIGDMFKQDYSDATIVYFDNTMYTKELIDVFRILPKECLFIYKAGGAATGDHFFILETSYNSRKVVEAKEGVSDLGKFWIRRASWRIIH